MNHPTAPPPAPVHAADLSDSPPPAPSKTSDALSPELLTRVEAILISVDKPINAGKIADSLGLESPKPVHQAVKALNDFYDRHRRAFRVEQVAGGFQILTRPELHEALASLHRTREDHRLSPAALETLAIVAYRQPIIRTDIEAIRGVSSGEMLRTLMDRHLIKIVGRAEELGRPMLYGTTPHFLQVFGLASLKDLPRAEELAQP